ncbi:DUF6807 family protein [Jiangella endophytica]|uniref:DUF6807 family protein n=1 Tax=Jiangella endophytica TaxID=1623398 RepID=UPI0018E56FAC|nr:DUF6807 family protein [Jiangella endophytica]
MTDPSHPRPLRVAVVGAGAIARSSHLPSLARLAPRVEVVALVDVDLDRAKTLAADAGVPACYSDVDEMLAREQPDLVTLATPPVAHRAAAVAALRAGAWVWCEKPPALSLADYDAISAHEREGGPYAAYVFQHRFGSAATHLREQVRQGTLGRPLVGVCHTLWYRGPDYFQVPWRGRWETEGGGPTMGHGIHQMDLLLDILGDWDEVQAIAATLDRDTETEDLSAALVRFPGGAVVSVLNSLLSPRETSYLRFDFTDATVEVEHLYGYDNSHWRTTPAGHVEPDRASGWAPADDEASSHYVQLRGLVDCMERGVRPPASGADGRRVLELVAAIYRAAHERRPVTRAEMTGDAPFYRSMHDVAPAAAATGGLTVVDDDRCVVVRAGGVDLARYVYRPDTPAAEAPKPYLHPIRTLDGAIVSGFRPSDHRWHKGLQMTLSHVSGQNFWGGPSYVHGEGYQWLDNLGRIESVALTARAGADDVTLAERLRWTTADGRLWLEEDRTQRFHGVDPEVGCWVLDFTTSLVNVGGQDLHLGSPTTHGRPAAGYTGWFWRGPRSFTGGRVFGPELDSADELMGAVSPWVAYSGQHDDVDGGATLLAFAGTSTADVPLRWFARSDPFPVLAPSPAYDEEIVLAPGDTLGLTHRHVIVGHRCKRDEAERLARRFALHP